MKLINRRRTQSRRQFDGETVAWLIPIRAQGWERRVAPEVAGGTRMRPGLISVFDQQTHLLADVDVAPNTVLARIDRLQKRRNPVGWASRIGKRKDLQDSETSRT